MRGRCGHAQVRENEGRNAALQARLGRAQWPGRRAPGAGGKGFGGSLESSGPKPLARAASKAARGELLVGPSRARHPLATVRTARCSSLGALARGERRCARERQREKARGWIDGAARPPKAAGAPAAGGSRLTLRVALGSETVPASSSRSSSERAARTARWARNLPPPATTISRSAVTWSFRSRLKNSTAALGFATVDSVGLPSSPGPAAAAAAALMDDAAAAAIPVRCESSE